MQMIGCGYLIAVVWRPRSAFGTTSISDYFDATDTQAYTIAPKEVANEDKFEVLRRHVGSISGSAFDVNTMYQTYTPLAGQIPYAVCQSVNHGDMTQFVHMFIPLQGRITRYKGSSSNDLIEGGLSLILTGDENESILSHEAPWCVYNARLRFYDC